MVRSYLAHRLSSERTLPPSTHFWASHGAPQGATNHITPLSPRPPTGSSQGNCKQQVERH